MKLCEIHPFVRYIRYIEAGKENTNYYPTRAYDSRLFYTMDGEGIVEAEGKSFPMTHGGLLVVRAGQLYHIRRVEERRVRYLLISFDYSFDHADMMLPISLARKNCIEPEKLHDRFQFEDYAPLNAPFYVREALTVESLLTGLESGDRQSDPLLGTLQNSTDFTRVLMEAVRLKTRKLHKNEQEPSKEILTYLRAHFSEPLNNGRIGAEFHLHPNYVNALVKRATGLSLHRYLLRIRIANAVRLLDTTNRRVSEICTACGFENINHFTRYFQQETGTSPTGYRRNH